MPLNFILCKREWEPPDNIDLGAGFTEKQRAAYRLRVMVAEALREALLEVDGEAPDPGEFFVNFTGHLTRHGLNSYDMLIFAHPPEVDRDFDGRAERKAAIRDLMAAHLGATMAEHSEINWPKFDLVVVPMEGSGCTIAPNGGMLREWGTPKAVTDEAPEFAEQNAPHASS